MASTHVYVNWKKKKKSPHCENGQNWPKYLLLHYQRILWNIQKDGWSYLSAMNKKQREFDTSNYL